MKHTNTRHFNATISALDVETSVLGMATLVLGTVTLVLNAATAALNAEFPAISAIAELELLRRCVTELLIMKIWILFPNLPRYNFLHAHLHSSMSGNL